MIKETGIRKHSLDWCAEHSEKMSGINNPMYGRHRTTEEKEKMSKNRLRLECPHCNKIGVHHLMKRYHFDNCKLNIINETIIGEINELSPT